MTEKGLSPEDSREWFWRIRPMLRARRFDEALIEGVESRGGGGHYHVYHDSIGVEASGAAIACAHRNGDAMTTTHRNHGLLAALGSDVEDMFREILGKEGSRQLGRIGSYHLCDPDLGVPYTSALVGGSVPIAIGLAFGKAKIAKEEIAFCQFGDGAFGEGIVQESLNIASLWKVPIVFVCDNDAGEPFTGGSMSRAAESIALLAEVNKIPVTVIEPGYPRNVFSAVKDAASAARAGSGPQFIEVRSERWPGRDHHGLPEGPFDLTSVLSPGSSRWFEVDPVAQEARLLLKEGVSMDSLTDLDTDIRAEIARAFDKAKEARLAPPENVFADFGQSRR